MSSIRNALQLGAGLTLIAGTWSQIAVAAEPASQLQVLQRWKLGGAGGWDYLTMDSASHRLYISRGTRVDVVDADSGKIFGSIPDTQGVHGIALRPQFDTTVAIDFYNAAGSNVGSISQTASATAYNTSSDARLKEDFQPFDAGVIEHFHQIGFH